jgi:predicted ribosome quality control (RQC) complex YloA/Tae2 family protein
LAKIMPRFTLVYVASKGKPYRTIRIEGFEILVGKGSEENDHLTFDVAAPDDIWMHVDDGTPGSHVVIRVPDGAEPPQSVLETVAAITAWYSKARDKKIVSVCWCRARNVSKPRGAPAGLVQITNEKTLKVVPKPPDQ